MSPFAEHYTIAQHTQASPQQHLVTALQQTAVKEMVSKYNSNEDIAATLSRKKRTVAHIVKQVCSGSRVPRPDRRGRPCALTEWDSRALVRVVRAIRFASLDTRTTLVNGVPASSAPTVLWMLDIIGYKSMSPDMQPWVRDLNQAKRVSCVRFHRGWME